MACPTPVSGGMQTVVGGRLSDWNVRERSWVDSKGEWVWGHSVGQATETPEKHMQQALCQAPKWQVCALC